MPMMEFIWSNKYIEKKWDVGLLNVKFFQNWNQDQNCMSSSENQAHSVHQCSNVLPVSWELDEGKIVVDDHDRMIKVIYC